MRNTKKNFVYICMKHSKKLILLYIYIVPEDNLHYLLKYYFIIKIFFKD